MISTYLSYMTFERNYGRPVEPINTEEIEPTRDLVQEGAYFKSRIGQINSGKELAADDRLFRYALTAFGMSDQVENKDFIIRVLDEGVFDSFAPFTSRDERPRPGENPINDLAEALWFGSDFVIDATKQVKTEEIIKKFDRTFPPIGRSAETQAFIDEKVTYFRENAPKAFSAKQLLSDPNLSGFVLRAFGLEGEAGNSDLILKAMEAGVYNPGSGVRKEGSLANTTEDSRFEVFARAFAFAEVGDRNVKDSRFIDTVIERYNREVTQANAKAEAAEKLERRKAPLPKIVQRDIDYFRENIGKISSPEELLKDERLYRFALTAFDLESQIPSRALIKKVLEEGVRDEDSLANQLIDKKYLSFARAFAFAEVGDRNVRDPNFVEGVVERYSRVKLETDAGEDNVGVRLAAYFDRKGPTLGNWFAVLGDKALREVMFTALDLPNEMQQTNPDKLKQIFEDRMDIADFKDPEKRAKFIQRFTLMYDIRNGGTGGAAGGNILALYGIDGSGGGAGGLSIDAATAGAKIFG